VGYDRKRLATALRDDLTAVGVTRAILFEENAPNVEPLRFHDLRSTFCTWARRAAKSDAWISERTGHELSGDMISRYDRGAQTLADLDYEPFPDVSGAVPELAEIVTRLHTQLHKPAAEPPESPQPIPPKNTVISDAYFSSGREDLNLRPLGPEPSALPGCATPRAAASRSRKASAHGGPALMAGRSPYVNGLFTRPKATVDRA
jgi:hypothetical protein